MVRSSEGMHVQLPRLPKQPDLPDPMAGRLMRCALAKEQQIERDTMAWLDQAVLGLQLCPFARVPIEQHRLRFAVTTACNRAQLLEELERELVLLTSIDAQTIETTLLIHPEVLTEFIEFHWFQAETSALLKRMQLNGVVQLATFHPSYQFAGDNADAITNYTNRSPYPMLHLLREDSVTRAVASMPDPMQIVERNRVTLERLGHAGWMRLFALQEGANGS